MSPLIELDELLSIADKVILIDARAGADANQRYLNGHLPGAQFADLDRDLAIKPEDPAYGGRHPLPPIHDFAKQLGQWGTTPESHVVVYDDKSGAFGGARLWWMLRAVGHEKVQVLNGGLKAAIDAGVKLNTETYTAEPVASYPVPSEYKNTVDIRQVETAAKDGDQMVIDVREAYRYLGESEPIDLVAGHIPGAVNMPYVLNMDTFGKYLEPGELRGSYEKLLGNVDPENVVVHCGSGVTACHTLLGMEYAGITGAKMYVGSWSEWSRRGQPIATGE